MRRLFTVAGFLACMLGSVFGSWSAAQDLNFKAEQKQLKLRQKQERKSQRLQHTYRKRSFNGQPVIKSVRVQAKHERQKEDRALRERQKNERQDLKDRQRLARETQRQY